MACTTTTTACISTTATATTITGHLSAYTHLQLLQVFKSPRLPSSSRIFAIPLLLSGSACFLSFDFCSSLLWPLLSLDLLCIVSANCTKLPPERAPRSQSQSTHISSVHAIPASSPTPRLKHIKLF
ncbi:hypothetical protein B0H14DRAFT_3473896 [Mycena olivaceomarginata]|nr:hypothetical protein B0H14DRAFT_3473896 [Mycena olivaceomarginata]